MKQHRATGQPPDHSTIALERDPDFTAYQFGPFCLHAPYGPLLRDNNEIKLQRKAISVLLALIRSAHEIIPRDTLMAEAWSGMVVGNDAVDYQVRMLRRALKDRPRHPQYIETIHGVGFRFIAPLRVVSQSQQAIDTIPAFPIHHESTLACLDTAFLHTLQGRRQLFLILEQERDSTHRLFENFLRGTDSYPLFHASSRCSADNNVKVCFEPVIDALRRLCQSRHYDDVKRILYQRAPSVLARFPALLSNTTPKHHHQNKPANQEQIAVELADSLKALADICPLLLFLEDFHHSDYATRRVLTLLAQQTRSARLMLVASYRLGLEEDQSQAHAWINESVLRGWMQKLLLPSAPGHE